jgi:hypothetical protein
MREDSLGSRLMQGVTGNRKRKGRASRFPEGEARLQRRIEQGWMKPEIRTLELDLSAARFRQQLTRAGAE